jgi:hypothetical protein
MIWPFKKVKPTLEQQVIERAKALGWPMPAAESAAKIAVDEYGPEPANSADLGNICAEVLRTDGEA